MRKTIFLTALALGAALPASAMAQAVAAVPDGVVVAWTDGPPEGSVIRVTRAQ